MAGASESLGGRTLNIPVILLRVRLRCLALLVLVLVALPLVVELVENGFHLLAHGDTAHFSDSEGHQPLSQEHGCGGTFHLCSCCRSLSGDTPALAALPAPAAPVLSVMAAEPLANATGFARSYRRPPRT